MKGVEAEEERKLRSEKEDFRREIDSIKKVRSECFGSVRMGVRNS